MSDGRFAILGGKDANDEPLSSCEALVVGHDEHWEPKYATNARGEVPNRMRSRGRMHRGRRSVE
jgi:hypothetical protein